jgi:D-alanyl-D-alanine carboxypeptidase/D-alanyl-D-alanine-endopeptidase (penicillin-binding protein 4)
MTMPADPALTRRAVVAAILSAAALPALAEAPVRSPRPPPRPPARVAGTARAAGATGTSADLVAAARLGGKVAFAVLDAASGAVLDAIEPETALPPASVAKAVTALYALDRLGPAHRFVTRVIATGPVAGGVVEGDIALVGGGDPTLDTDRLGALVEGLRARGIRGATGRFLIHAAALPAARMIDEDQPAHVGYNPAVGGLNLNFNRAHFEWKRAPDGWRVQVDARGERFVPLVRGVRVRIVERESPVFAYDDRDGVEHWTVAARALGEGGSRWLPLRRPADHVGEVFRTLAAAQGVTLGAPQAATGGAPGGTVLAETASDPLGPILRAMLRHSTNLTAEVLGLASSGARSLRDSAAAMAAWAEARYGASARLVDHSGLGGASRISPLAMARILARAHGEGALPPLLRAFPARENGRPRVVAKTGTLNFVSGLGGYVTAPSGRVLAFAIFAADTARRDGLVGEARERPPGGAEWTRRARGMQARLIDRWAGLYG